MLPKNWHRHVGCERARRYRRAGRTSRSRVERLEYELVDNNLWFPIRMLFTFSVVLVIGGAGIFVLLRLIEERDHLGDRPR